MNKTWRERLLRYAIGGLELLIFYAVLSLVNYKATGSSLSITAILSIYIVSFIFNRLIFLSKIKAPFSIPLNVLLWIVYLQLVIKVESFSDTSLTDPAFIFAVPQALVNYAADYRFVLVVFLTSIPIWMLGARLGRMRIGFGVSLAEFQSGLAIILLTYFLNSQISASAISSPLVPVVYIALAIFALTISHAERASSWLSSRHAAYWFALLIVSIVVIVAVGLFAGIFTSHDMLDLLFTPVRWLWWLFSKFMLFLAEHTPMNQYLSPADWGAVKNAPEDPEEVFKMFTLPIWLRDILRFVLFVGWGAFILLAFWRLSSFLIHWLRSHFVGRTEAEVESLHGAFKDDILVFLRRIWHWIVHLFIKDRSERTTAEVQSVRQIYRELLSWGAVKGLKRQSDATPYEYLSVLSEAVPFAAADLQFITDRYVSTRYGSVLPGGQEITELKTIWQRIKRNGYTHK